MVKKIVIIIATVMAGVAVSETVVVSAQSNSTKPDGRNIIVTWLKTNDTKTSASPATSVSSEDFWVVFGSLLKPLINGSISSSE